MSCRLQIRKLGRCLQYNIEDYTKKPDADRLHVPRKDGRRGLIAIENCVELVVRGLEVYVHRSEERLIQGARGD